MPNGSTADGVQGLLPDPQHRARGALSDPRRAPCSGAAGVARHDAVAWGYARAADACGVDIIQNCEVTGLTSSSGRIDRRRDDARLDRRQEGRDRRRRPFGACWPAWPASACRSRATRCRRWSPSRSSRCSTASSCRTRCMSMSASRTRASWCIGAGIDAFNSYAQRGSLHIIEDQLAALCELFPIFSGCRMMRQLGRHRRCTARTPRRSSARRRSRPLSSIAAGAPAASRRRPAPAGSCA